MISNEGVRDAVRDGLRGANHSNSLAIARICNDADRPRLRPHDQQRLAAFLELDLDTFRERYTMTRGGKVQVCSSADGCCVFFDPQALCTVHTARPDICRAWPFFRGNLLDPTSLRFAKEACPGIAADVSFADFVQAGQEALAEQGLRCESGPEAPCALCALSLSVPTDRPEHSS